eukprot:Gb_13821 [translate_table: standard]
MGHFSQHISSKIESSRIELPNGSLRQRISRIAIPLNSIGFYPFVRKLTRYFKKVLEACLVLTSLSGYKLLSGPLFGMWLFYSVGIQTKRRIILPEMLACATTLRKLLSSPLSLSLRQTFFISFSLIYLAARSGSGKLIQSSVLVPDENFSTSTLHI